MSCAGKVREIERNLPLKLSATPFCQGLPGSINVVPMCDRIRSARVIEVLSRLVSARGAPRFLRSDNGLLSWIVHFFQINSGCSGQVGQVYSVGYEASEVYSLPCCVHSRQSVGRR
jgi:hypothetical protein